MGHRLAGLLVVLSAAAASWAEPPASQPALGRISGTLAPPEAVRAVRCIDRDGGLSYPVRWDAKAGRFAVAELAPRRRYDFEVQAADGRSFIGVDLSREQDRLLRLAGEPEQQDEKPGELTDDDRRQIERIVTDVETFHDRQRIVQLRGDHAAAAALVELLRTRPFHGGKAGEWIRRVEVWQFKFQHGGWEKLANAERVLSRARAPRAEIEKQMAREVYVPQLGGILVEPGRLDVTIDVALPGFGGGSPATTAPDSP